jgi:predicted membrane metal-binding protein
MIVMVGKGSPKVSMISRGSPKFGRMLATTSSSMKKISPQSRLAKNTTGIYCLFIISQYSSQCTFIMYLND